MSSRPVIASMQRGEHRVFVHLRGARRYIGTTYVPKCRTSSEPAKVPGWGGSAGDVDDDPGEEGAAEEGGEPPDPEDEPVAEHSLVVAVAGLARPDGFEGLLLTEDALVDETLDLRIPGDEGGPGVGLLVPRDDPVENQPPEAIRGHLVVVPHVSVLGAPDGRLERF